MDKETKLAIICFGILPSICGLIIGYYAMGLTSYKLFLYTILHPLLIWVIILLAAKSAEKEVKKVRG